MHQDQLTVEFAISRASYGRSGGAPRFPRVSSVGLKELLDKLTEKGFTADDSNSEISFAGRIVEEGCSSDVPLRVPISYLAPESDAFRKAVVTGYTLRDASGHTRIVLSNYDDSRSAGSRGQIGGPVNYVGGIDVKIYCPNTGESEFRRAGELKKVLCEIFDPLSNKSVT